MLTFQTKGHQITLFCIQYNFLELYPWIPLRKGGPLPALSQLAHTITDDCKSDTYNFS